MRWTPILAIISVLLSASSWVAADTDWSLHGGDWGEQRHSPLTQINRENVEALGLAWAYPLGTRRGVEATPLVADGVIYTTATWSVVHALDAHTGKLLWRYDPEVPGDTARKACCDVVNRGVAIHGDSILLGTLDGRLIALDKHSGKALWSVVTVDQSRAYTITGAPRIAKDMVIIGNGGADLGVRGYVSAYDVKDGSLRWRFYTVPGAPDGEDEHPELELARQTWSPDSQWHTGLGGTVWDSMVYDPELDLLYVGTGNSANYNRAQRSPGGGDNLYLSSLLALDPNSGRLRWHYQTTPAESWDYTSTQHIVLADIEWQGRTRKVLMQAPKNGFFYMLDRQTGELLSAEPYVPMNWASHVDMTTGRPVENDVADWSAQKRMVLPSIAGGHNWQPMSYSPATGLVYIHTRNQAYLYWADPDFVFRPLAFNTGENFPALEKQVSKFRVRQCSPTQLTAWDPQAQSIRWQVAMDSVVSAGVLSTAGGLVFQGRGDAHFLAYDDLTGEELWRVPTNTPMVAPPISYSTRGQQTVLVSTGMGGGSLAVNPAPYENDGYLLAFRLQGDATLPPRKPRPSRSINLPADLTTAVQDEGNAMRIETGRQLYTRHCLVCHGIAAINPGALPDLRYAGPEVHRDWSGIVLGGLRSDKGMASFADALTLQQAEDVQLYVAHSALENERWHWQLLAGIAENVCIPAAWLADE